MPRTPEQYEEIRNGKKRIILKTALELFAKQGYKSTSIRCIAQKAEISKGLMYNYFKSKDELLKTIILNMMDEIFDSLEANKDNKLCDDEALQFLDNYFEILMTKTEELKLYSQLTIQPEVISFVTEHSIMSHIQTQQELIKPFMYEKHKENAPLMLLNFSAIIKGITILYVFSPEKYPIELMMKYKEYLKDMFVRAVNGERYTVHGERYTADGERLIMNYEL